MVKEQCQDETPAVHGVATAIDWEGPDDADNPRNFSLRRRVSSTIAVTFLAFVSTLAASIYSPAHDDVSTNFGVSDEVAILPLSLYNFGLAFGPLAGSPLSETFGRKVVFLTTTPLFGLFILGAGLSPSAPSLIICRFFAGVFASPAISNASATIIDYTAGRYRAVSLAFYYSIPFFGAVFGPLLGGFIVERKSWRWTQWVTLFFIVTFYIPILFTKETYKKTILQRRARRLNVQGPPEHKRSVVASAKHFFTTLLVRPVHMILTEPIVTLVCLYNGFLFGLMYTFVVASPWIFQHYYGFDLTGQSLSFLGLMAGTAFAPGPLILIDAYIYQPRLKQYRNEHPEAEGRSPPEYRLYPSMISSFMLPACLFIFAWATRPNIHWIVPIIFQGLAIMTTVMTYSSANLFMVDSYGPLYGASAAGAAMLSRYGLSAAFPLFALQLYKTLGVGWATTFLAFCTLAMAPIPWLFWRYGPLLRARTKYETAA
ncbi:major facilitator superfamily domain-containing protein [Exophiala viscosa]|uniref:major facilitator superfamily domain-containing protein n=1 Tax=Exophiala viscosa TaxID=2486360 RepID=UPI00218E9240|nr:major facilitator superfamily domain-containing protein [Exophiala viscosa]